jgi:hypothetical protein
MITFISSPIYIKHCIFRPPFWTPRDKIFRVSYVFCPYLKENNSSPLKTCLLTLFKEIILVDTELYRNINYKMQNYWSLKHLVHIVVIRLKRLRTSDESPVRRSHFHSCRYTADVHATFRVFQTGSEQPSKHVTLFGMILIKPWPIFPVTVWDKITRDRSEIKGRGRVDITQGDNALKQVCEN